MRFLGRINTRFASNHEFERSLIEKLDSLAKSTGELDRRLADYTSAEKLTLRKALPGLILVGVTLILIVVSTIALLSSSSYKDQQSYYFDQALTLSNQAEEIVRPFHDITIIDNGLDGFGFISPDESEMSGSELKALHAADSLEGKVTADYSKSLSLEHEWYNYQYFGQIVLTISSAFFGAIAGWLVVGIFANRRRPPSARPPRPT